MKARILCLSAALAVVVPGTARVLAHHSFAGEFEGYEKTWTGTVTKIQFRTPHVHIYVDVKDDGGKVTNWGFEMPSPEQLQRRGMSRSSFGVGDVLTFTAYPAKDNQPLAMTRQVKLPEGRTVFVWNYEDFGATKSDEVVVDPEGVRQGR